MEVTQMLKKLSLIIALLVILGLVVPGLALGQEPSGDFEVVQSKVEEWLASQPKSGHHG
jgi:hypothetical protein